MFVSEVKKVRNNVEVKFENYEQIIVPYEIFIKNYFSKGDDLTQEKFDELKNQTEIYKITQSSLRYLSGRNHSKYELKLKLQKKQYNIDKIDQVITNLEKQNFLNDEEFAKYFYQIQIHKKKGALKIKSDLYKKGVSRIIIENIIKENTGIDEFIKNAKVLAKKKISTLKKKELSDLQIRQKVFQFLASRGFTSEVIFKTLKIEELD